MDESLFRSLNESLSGPFMQKFMVAVTTPETWILPGIALAGAFVWIDRRRGVFTILAILISVGAGDALAHNLLKPISGRKRPCATLENVVLPKEIGCTDSYSLPSNHAVNSFALMAAAGVMFPRSLLLLAPMAFLVAVSRVAVGVHFPLDVTAGAIIGTLIGFGVATLVKRKAGIEPGMKVQEDG